MISFKINGSYLELYSDISYEITETSSIFTENAVGENSIYNFSIPRGINDSILGYPGRYTNVGKKESYNCEIYFNNSLRYIGTALVTDIYENSIDIAVGIKDSSFFFKIKDKKLTDYYYGGTIVYFREYYGEGNSLLNVIDGFYPAEKFAYFPVRNIALYDGTEKETAWRASDIPSTILDRPYQNNFFIGAVDAENYYYLPGREITPFPYVGYVIECILKEEGYTIDKNIFEKIEYLGKLCIYNPNMILKNRLDDNYNINISEHVPGISVDDFLSALKSIGIYIKINDTNNIASVDFIKDDVQTIKKLDNYSANKQNKNQETKGYKIKLTVDSNDQYASNNQKPDDLQKYRNRGIVSGVSDLAGILNPVIKDIAKVQIENKWYIFDLVEDTGDYGWQYLCYDIQNVSSNPDADSETDYTIPFSTLYCEERAIKSVSLTETIDDVWYVPSVELAGNFRNLPMVKYQPFNEFGLKLMFYWGKEQTLHGSMYPVGSSTIFKTGNLLLSNQPDCSLIPNHPFDIYSQKINFILKTIANNNKLTIVKDMSDYDIKNFKMSDVYLIDGRYFYLTSKKYKIDNSKSIFTLEFEAIEKID